MQKSQSQNPSAHNQPNAPFSPFAPIRCEWSGRDSYCLNEAAMNQIWRVKDMLFVMSASGGRSNDALEEALCSTLGFMADMLEQATTRTDTPQN